MATETKLNEFKINYLTKEQYEEAVRNNEINENELYMTPQEPESTSASWDDIKGKPSTFPPSTHAHSKSDVGLGRVDNTPDSEKRVDFAFTAQEVSGMVAVTSGGTGASTIPAARANLKAHNITISVNEPSSYQQNNGDIWLEMQYY